MNNEHKSNGSSSETDSSDSSSLGNSGGELIATATEAGQELIATATGAGQELQSQVVGLTHQVRQQATEQIASQKERLVDTLDMVALLLRQSGEHAQLQEKAMLAGYLDKASGEVDKWSKMVDTKDATELVAQTKQFASRQPLIFVGGALAAGFLGTRFLRSSAQALPSSQPASANGTLDATDPTPPVSDQADIDHVERMTGKSAPSDRAENIASSPAGDQTSQGFDDLFEAEDAQKLPFDDALFDDAMSAERR